MAFVAHFQWNETTIYEFKKQIITFLALAFGCRDAHRTIPKWQSHKSQITADLEHINYPIRKMK